MTKGIIKDINIEELEEIITRQQTGVFTIPSGHLMKLKKYIYYLQKENLFEENGITYTYYEIDNKIKIILHRPFKVSDGYSWRYNG